MLAHLTLLALNLLLASVTASLQTSFHLRGGTPDPPTTINCGKASHPDDCAFVRDLYSELRSQCGEGQKFTTDIIQMVASRGQVCDISEIRCTEGNAGRVQAVQFDLTTPYAASTGCYVEVVDQWGRPQKVFEAPNGTKAFDLPASSAKLTNLTTLDLRGLTNVCDLQGATQLSAMTRLYIGVQPAETQTTRPTCAHKVLFPQIPNRTSHPLVSLGFSNVDFKTSTLPITFGVTFLQRFECTNCSLSGSLPRGIIASVGCPFDQIKKISGCYDQKLCGECDEETNVCPPQVCAQFPWEASERGMNNIAHDFGVYMPGNDFRDVLSIKDVVRCSSGKKLDAYGSSTKKMTQIACNFAGSYVIFPTDPVAFGARPENDVPLLLSGVGVGGSIPSWLFKSYTWTTIDLSCNDLVGTIPSSIMLQSTADRVHLHENRLEGTIPDLATLKGIRTRPAPFPKSNGGGLWDYDVTLHGNLFDGAVLPLGLFTLCNWVGDAAAPFLKCGLRVDEHLQQTSLIQIQPTNKFSLPSPDKETCATFGPGVDVLRLSSMGLSCHVSELLHFVKACYPDLVELDANPPLDTWDDFGNTLVRNRWLHGDLPSPLLLPKKLKRLSFHRTSITGQLPPGSDIAQLDYFNVDNTTIDGPIPKDWSKHVSLRFVQPLTQCKEKCLIENTLSQFTVPADLAGVGGWWVPYAMPHEIDPELFLAYWKECHAVLDQSVGTQACAVFSVPFVRPLSVANYDTRLDYMLGARLPTSPFPTSHIVSNSNVTDIGGFAGVFGGKIPASFMYAASLAFPAVTTIDFRQNAYFRQYDTSSGRKYTCSNSLCGEVPDVLWSGFSKVESVHMRRLRVSTSVDSHKGPAQSTQLRLLTSKGDYHGEAPTSLVRACASSDVECFLQNALSYSSPCNSMWHSYSLPNDLSSLSDLKTLNLTGAFCMCDEDGPSLTHKLKQLPNIEILDLSSNPCLLLERAAVKSMGKLTTLRTARQNLNSGNAPYPWGGELGVRFEQGVTLDGFLKGGLAGKNMLSLEVSSAISIDPSSLPLKFSPGFAYGILSSDALAQFPNLRVLDVGTTNAVADVSNVLAATCDMSQLEVIRLNGNEMRGTIPACLDGLAHLKQLAVGSVGGKSIVGKVPGKLGERCVSKGSDHVQCTFCPNVELDWCQ